LKSGACTGAANASVMLTLRQISLPSVPLLSKSSRTVTYSEQNVTYLAIKIKWTMDEIGPEVFYYSQELNETFLSVYAQALCDGWPAT
jgi:hypothetical protein